MSTPPDFSDPSVSGSHYSDGSALSDPGDYQEFLEYYRRYARESTFTPQPTVGFGSSIYGPRPEQIRVANTGPAAGARVVYRADLEPLYRWDSRPPEVIFRDGFQPHNGRLPSSLQYYQSEQTETGLVSTTRDLNPDAAQPSWARNSAGHSFRYTIHAPGGYEFLASLTHHASFYGQQEVAFWKGIRPEYIAQVDVFDRSGLRVVSQLNPNAHAATAVAAERERRNQQVLAQIAATRRTTAPPQPTHPAPPNAQIAYYASLTPGPSQQPPRQPQPGQPSGWQQYHGGNHQAQGRGRR
ncbi:hypothetical protein ACFY3N_36485 [Streptomyces sp. NPDC000348]|uniref:scabin-related ADP-ribosyltransferase n=1 Tax=Streptomyces sp. NPDC000348 TaxID=3364538 RepID=UPI003679A2CC